MEPARRNLGKWQRTQDSLYTGRDLSREPLPNTSQKRYRLNQFAFLFLYQLSYEIFRKFAIGADSDLRNIQAMKPEAIGGAFRNSDRRLYVLTDVLRVLPQSQQVRGVGEGTKYSESTPYFQS
jgi:hypothetical protein